MQLLTRTSLALFAVDVRALAALRIALGVLLLADLANRTPDLCAHYADAGTLPRDTLRALRPGTWPLSVHMLGGGTAFQAALFVLAAGVAAALLAGWRTRIATALSWFLLASLHARNPLVLQGGDTLLRLLLFWSLFLPLGAIWSLDARRAGDTSPPRRIVSPATAALLLQTCAVYWMSGLQKSHPVWQVEARAVADALALDSFATAFGRSLLAHPDLLRASSRIVLWTEIIAPLLAFVPVCTARIRVAVVLTFVAMHLGFALCLELGLFPLTSAASWLVFLPASFWDRVTRAPVRAETAPVLYGSTAAGVAAFLLLAYVAWWNVGVLDDRREMPIGLRRAGRMLGLQQQWKMFAPAPPRADGWYVVAGRRADGSWGDALRAGRALDWRKPALVSATYPSQRWRKYLVNLSRKRYAGYRADYARWSCRAGCASAEPAWRGVRVVYVREAHWTAGVRVPASPRVLARRRCRE